MNLDLVFEELLPHPIEAVWSALTDRAAISDWLMETAEFEPLVGSRFRLKTERLAPDGWVDADVTELDPPRRMAWAWSVKDGNLPTTVTFELVPESEGIRLKLTHVGEIDPVVAGLVKGGWPVKIEALRRSLG